MKELPEPKKMEPEKGPGKKELPQLEQELIQPQREQSEKQEQSEKKESEE